MVGRLSGCRSQRSDVPRSQSPLCPLSQILQDLEIKHTELIAAWQQFALAANITGATLPPAYQVSENIRNLLAYAANIALKHQHALIGLQLRFRLPAAALPLSEVLTYA